MKKLRFGILLFLSACIMITILCPTAEANGTGSPAGPIIADHSNATLADLEAIPIEWINKAKSDLHIYYNHTSHGSQVTSGMTGLAAFMGSTYAWNTSGSNGALHLADTYSTDLGDSNWPSITRNYLKSHPDINVVMWSWCGQVSTASESYINSYLENMSQLEEDYPNVKFVYMTGHTDGTGANGNLHLRNEQIRRYCRTNNKILFDFADIESYDPDGNYYLDKNVNDECYYDSDGNGSRESNWATAWQNSHTKNVEWYDCSSAHSQPINANMKAYAAWYLWARLAGWDGTDGSGGTSQPEPVSSVRQLTARHYEGQTILTWNEVDEVAAAVSPTMTIQQVRNVRASFNSISYRIYRSNSPITSVTGLSPIKTAGVLTGWDDEFYGRENGNIDNQSCPRFVVEKDINDTAAAPVSANTAVSAYNPENAGTAYYAVTVVRNGVEEKLVGSGNTVTVNETVGQGIPILQKTETVKDYYYTSGTSTHYYYIRWESPPNSNVHGTPMDYKVIVPQSYVPGNPVPVNMSFHGWGSNMHVQSGWWYNFDKGTIVITTNQLPYDWWTGYHEKYGISERSQQNWASGVVRPYTQSRLSSFCDWASAKWSLDSSRTIAAGVSMGGSGSIMYGIRNPDRVAWVNSWVGVHVPAESPTFRSSYQVVYGDVDWQIKYQDGVTPAFSYFDDDWYLRNHISDETPFITFSNGKNDSSIGWSQAVKFVNALQDTKRPHIFYWGQSGHNQRTLNPPDINGNRSESTNPIDIRTDQSLPAFTNCSLDDDPGNGNTDNGDESGQINAYMFWKTEDIVDTQNRWEMTIGVVKTAPAQSCTVSLTPRRLQNFDPTPGKVYYWTNTSLSNNMQIQSGTVTCDSYGLITIDNLTVNRITSSGGGNRIVIFTDDSSIPVEPPVDLSGPIVTFEDGKTPTSVIHVAANGNDSTGNGSAASPYRSIGRALQAASPGTAIRIHPGTYSGRVSINGLSGTAQAPIWIGGAPGEAKPVITSSSEGIHLTKVHYLILHDLEISNTQENAINCDDGGEYNNKDATRYVIFRDLYIHDVNTSANEDGIKLSGVNDYYILNCEIARCANAYGSGIDLVGCHNGIIAGNYLHDFSGTGITCKGGSENIHIRQNRLSDCGERAVNIGGSSDFAFFRPSLSTTQPNYEAKNIHVYSNLMRGSIAPIAFAGATDCSAVNNTVISPENWLMRILQERTSTSQYTFGPCSNNTVANNIFYYNGSALSQYGAINVGNNTSPATFTFSNNLWYNYTSPQDSRPNLPVTETGGIYGQDPLFANLAGNNVSLHINSPALGSGVSSATALYDFNGDPFGNPRNIGAVAGSTSAVQNQPPVLAAIGPKTVASGSLLSFTVSASDPDAGDTLFYSVSPVSPAALPGGISIDSSTGAFSWTPGQNQCGTFTVRITVSDGELSDSENVVISVFDSATDLYSIRLKYIPVIDSSMKANLRAIKLRGDAKGRAEGVLGQWGDSITHSQAYLGSMASWGMITTPPSNGHDYEPILMWMGASPNNDNNPLHNFKGGRYGNDSGWRITNGLAAISDAIKAVNPSWSLTMFGTNDITSWNAQSFETNLERFIQINIDEGIIPVLSTIPPRTNYDQQVGEANTVIRRTAQKMNIPLVDLYGLFMELHPNDWSSVLLSDGVHPSHSYGSGDLSDAALRNDGYNIRSVLTLDMAEKLKRVIFDNGPADGPQSPILTVSSATHPYKTMSTGLDAVFQISHDSGPAPSGYSWVLDQSPDTAPDTVSDGSSAAINVKIPSDGTWYFHVRGVSQNVWGPAAHYCIIASEYPRIFIRRTDEDPVAVHDTYISQLWGGDDNFGGSSILNIYNDDATKRTRGLFRFDLSGVSKTGITSAKLKLWASSPVTSDIDYELFAVTASWAEGTGTWNNGDHSGVVWNDGLSFGSTPIVTGTMAEGQEYLEADVTDQVLSWLNGTPNYGFMLQHLETWKALELITSEFGFREMRPTLEINYNTPPEQQNYAPVLSPIGPKTVNEGEQLSFTVNASDRDPGDTLVWSISPVIPSVVPAGISFNTATHVFTWTPGDEQSGIYKLRFTVSDGKQIDYEDIVITVRNMSITPPQGRNVRVTSVAELRSAITNAQDGDMIIIADGDYRNSSPLILDNVDNIAVRSESNDPAKVILRGRSEFTGTGSYDELDDILRIGDCNNVSISGLTFTEAHGYGIKLELDGDSNPNAITIENCRFIDIGTRHIKGTRDSNSATKQIKGGAIRNCYFENTVTPPAAGGWHFDGNYTGGIDLMALDGWVIEDNEFRNIQGITGEGCSAIMIWYFSENLTIQRNRIINCDRGITLGLPDSNLNGGFHVKSALVMNNFILPGSRSGYQSDAGIECSDVDNVRIYNNTIWRLNNDYNGRGIRFIQNIANTQMVNNLVYGRLVFDNDLTISRNDHNLNGNLSSGYVANVQSGDLHLTSSAAGAINKGVQLAEVTEDIDGNTRDTTPDIGADEYAASGGGTADPGGGTTNPGGSTTNPGGGTANPGGGTTNPGGGTTNPGGGTANPGGGTTNPGSVIIPPPVGGNIPDTAATSLTATVTTTSGTTVTQSLVVSDGTAKAAADAEQLRSAINQASPGKDGIRSVTLTLPEIREASTYQQEIPADLFRKGTSKERYEIKTPVADISVPGNMFPAASTDKKQQMGISVSYADLSKLNKELVDKIGSRPAINIAAYADGRLIEWKNKNAPVTITIDYTPTEEELKKPDHIVVWYIDGKGNVITVPNGRYDPDTGKLTFKVTHFSIYAVSYAEKTYDDISKAYAKAAIEALASKGFYEWIEGSSFEPDRSITRGEFLYLLITALDIDGTYEDNFSDVDPGDLYYEAAGIAKKYGISYGTGGGRFGAKQNITREEMATMVARALKAAKNEYPEADISELIKFSDAGKISSYAKESLAILVKAGFLVGYRNSLDPKGTFTMQQAATVIWRIYKDGAK